MPMDYVAPAKFVDTMIEAGAAKAGASLRDLLIRGFLSGALLGFATSLAITTAVQTSMPIAGAVIFPVGFVMIVLLGLELVTGNFALIPVAMLEGRCTALRAMRNFAVVFTANLAGSLFYGLLLVASLTMAGRQVPDAVASRIIAIAQTKTHYTSFGLSGYVAMLAKAVLCNWMVCLGVVMGMTSTSTVGKIVAAWLPILVFFAHGYEHSVVNMFLIPTGMLLGAKVTMVDWWIGNQIPVTMGNFLGGCLLTGLPIYWTHRSRDAAAPRAAPRAARDEPDRGKA
jgi:formate transporter